MTYADLAGFTLDRDLGDLYEMSKVPFVANWNTCYVLARYARKLMG